MGALAPALLWIPEDDLLLKNAVEAGASLESLAKGAVRFSRRFTIQELQDRWYSLLYEKDTSEEASARIIEIEIDLSVSNDSKFNRGFGSKGLEYKSGKRKGGSLRSNYHAMRKRVCTKPYQHDSYSFDMPLSGYVYNGNDLYDEHLNPTEQLLGDCFPGAQMAGDPHIPDTDFDIEQDGFPEMLGVNADFAGDTGDAAVNGMAHDFHTDQMDSIADGLEDVTFGNGRVYGHDEVVIPKPPVDKGLGESVHQSYEERVEFKDIPCTFEENPITFPDNATLKLEQNNFCEANDMESKPMPNFDLATDNQGKICTGFEGNQNLKLENVDSGGSFQHMEYSPPLPGMPIWETVDQISLPSLSVIPGSFEDGGNGKSVPYIISAEDVKQMSSAGCNAPTEPILYDENFCSETGSPEGDYMYVQINVNNDGNAFFAETVEHFNNFLMNSPIDGHQDDVSNSSDPKVMAILEDCHVTPHIACIGENKDAGVQILMNSPIDGHQDETPNSGDREVVAILDDCHLTAHTAITEETRDAGFHKPVNSETDGHQDDVPNSGDPMPILDECHLTPHTAFTGETKDSCVQILSEHANGNDDFDSAPLLRYVSSKALDVSKALEGFVCCVLNEEDPEIPCNDDIFIPPRVIPSFPSKIHVDEGNIAVLNTAKEDHETSASYFPTSTNQLSGCPSLAELCGLPSLARPSSNSSSSLNPCRAPHVTSLSAALNSSRGDITACNLGEHRDVNNPSDSFSEKPVKGSVDGKTSCPNIADCCKQEVEIAGTMDACLPSQVELVPGETGFSGTVQRISTSDEEDKCSDGEHDVPNFSDIEAMILEMDLDSDDQVSPIYTREVSRYRHLDTKKVIIRLEQGAHSYMQRAITSHGAFAVFYGRHLKYYIKKPEVILGRATEELDVDIDLGREGRANKISRRQAIIKLDEDGSFSIKNTGRSPILINGKEVPKGKCCNLSSGPSGCLIEIRGMAFTFEVNQNSVRQYLSSVSKEKIHASSNFNWLPNEIT